MLNQAFQGETTEYSAPCIFLLGGFDGLHIGHKKLIDCAKKYNLPVGIMSIEGGKGKNLFTPFERGKIFSRQGLNFIYSVPFTEEFKNTTKDKFLTSFIERFEVKAFVCGEDFRFGKSAEGTPEFIREFTGIPVHALGVLTVGGKKAGMFLVKEYLKNGEVERANKLLLQPFFLSGKVEAGRKTGRTLGFPTANFSYPENKFPLKEGVYAVHAQLGGKIYRGIANFGACPTFGVTYQKLEVYFDGYEGDLYGKEIDVYFNSYLRNVQKFENKEALKAQLKEDLLRVRTHPTEEKI